MKKPHPKSTIFVDESYVFGAVGCERIEDGATVKKIPNTFVAVLI
ncbi:hypothetical protein ACFY5J_24750 [Peribacillus butanolivorans]